MASIIDTHPKRQQIIDALLAGESLRSIVSWVSPPVSLAAVHRYRTNIVVPALKNADFATKILTGKELIPRSDDVSPEMKRVVAETSAALKAAPVLAVRENRLARLEDRAKRLDLIVSERSEEMEDIPGGKSGLLVRRIKSIGSGESAREVEEYEVDKTLLAELREHEKQAAMELGQWQEGSSSGTTIQIVTPAVTIAAAPQEQAIEDVVTIDIGPRR